MTFMPFPFTGFLVDWGNLPRIFYLLWYMLDHISPISITIVHKSLSFYSMSEKPRLRV